MKKELTCITCPRGCRITVVLNENREVESVSGNTCTRGERYAISECTHPVRMLSSTVRLTHAQQVLLPVATSAPIPKELLFSAMEEIRKICVEAPVERGQILVSDFMGTGVDLVASCSVN